MDPHPPKLEPTCFGWVKNEILQTLKPIGVPKDRKQAPDEVLKTIKCSCTSEKPCATNRGSCSSGKSSCSIVCSCCGHSWVTAMTRSRLTRKGKIMMTTQLIQMKKKNANELSLIFTWTLLVKLNFTVFQFCSCISRFIVL